MMTGKERVLKAIACKKVDRTPWVPFVGCHGGSLLGMSAEEYLQSTENIVKGVQAGIDRYKPDGVPVVFDLQVEAETFGCDLKWAEDNPPSVVTHPLSSMGKQHLTDLNVPGREDGRIGMCLEAAKRLRAANPDVALYGLITGPFTLALHLLGTEIFMLMFEDPEAVEEVMAFSRDVARAMAGYYVEAGCDIIAVVDPMTSQVSPDQFRQTVTPYATAVFAHIREQGAKGSFFVCGHAQQNVQAMCECQPDNISIDENIALDYVKEICLARGISFGGNMQLTSVLLLGSELESQKNAIECMEIGGEVGFLLAPGCDLPYATPPENLEAVAKVVADPYERDVVKTMAQEKAEGPVLDMREYGKTDTVIVDIITLDSEGCAPCQYMVESVKDIAPEFEGIVKWREHKIKYRESLVFMTSLFVKNIPTICIDGQITFVSQIPKREDLVAAIQRRIYEKLRMRIQSKKATLHVLGDGGEECQRMRSEAEKAVIELGAEVVVDMVTQEQQIQAFGLLPSQTPAVAMTTHAIKHTGGVPETAVMKEWIKDAVK